MFMTICICLQIDVNNSDTGHTFSFYSFHVSSVPVALFFKVSVM